MKPEPNPATPSLMTLLCIIGGAMRGVGPVGLGLQLLLIGVIVPEFGTLLKTWLRVEEYVAEGNTWVGYTGVEGAGDEGDGDAPDDGDGDGGEWRSGWVRQDGPVWLWRHVTRVGVMIVPIRWFSTFRCAELLPRGGDVAPAWSLSASLPNLFFGTAWGRTHNCDLIVPVS